MDFWKVTVATNNQCACSTDHALFTVFYITCHLTSLLERFYYHYHFIDGEIEAEEYSHDLNPGI